MQITKDYDDVDTFPESPPPPYSEAWWASLSAEDLHSLVKRGFAAGDIFFSAVAETRRREEQAAGRREFDAAAEAEARRHRKRRGVVGLIAAAIAIISLCVSVLLTAF